MRRVITVEDWADIHRLHRSERLSGAGDRQAVGDLTEHGRGGVGLTGPAEVRAGGAYLSFQRRQSGASGGTKSAGQRVGAAEDWIVL